MLSIKLLGQPRIELDGKAVDIRRRKSRALLYYLAAQAHPPTREYLLGLFWPDLDRAGAQQSLRTTLHGLRKTLDEWITVDGEQIGLSEAAAVDVRSFEKTLLSLPIDDVEQLQAALMLYRGDFLAGFSLDASPDFDDWLMTQSEYYRRLAVRGLSALAALLETQTNYSQALDTLDRALEFDPLQEDLQRNALRLHYLAGDRAGAIRRYDRLRKLLDEEMGVPPMAETRQLYEAILNDTVQAAPPRVSPRNSPAARQGQVSTPATTRVIQRHTLLPFTGRDREMDMLHEWCATAPHKFVLIEGEPGIGKTRLVQEFIAQKGIPALTGSAHELEHRLPYQPMIEALRSLLTIPQGPHLLENALTRTPNVWLNEVARLLPDMLLGRTWQTAPPDEARLWEGINQFLQTLAAPQPLIVFLDDIHWADSSTLALLGYLIRDTAQSAITFITTARPENSRSSLLTLQQSLIRTGQLARITLERLSPPDLHTIAHTLSASFAPPLAEWLGHTSEGNPYVLAELIRHARDNSIIQPDGMVNLTLISHSPVIPQTIYSLIQARLARLSDAARRIVDAAVAIGREFEFDIAYRAAGLSELAAMDALDELHASGFIQPRGKERYVFDHNLTLEVAYREVGEVRHRLLHRRVAEALEALSGRHCEEKAALIAFHFSEGNVPDRAAPYALRAGHQAIRLAAWTEAIEFFEQARVPGMPLEHEFAVSMALGDAQYRAGRITQASETLRDALRLMETAARTADNDNHREIHRARLALAETLFTQARYAEAVSLAEQYPPPDDIDSAVLAAKSELAIGTALSIEGADLDAASAHLQRGKQHLENAAEQYGDAAIDSLYTAHLNFELGSIAAQQGDLTQAIALYQTALAGAELSRDPDALGRTILAYNNIAYHSLLAGDPDAAEYAQKGLALAVESGMLAMQPYLYSTSGEIALAAGDLPQAETFFEHGIVLAEQTQNRERVAGLTANLGLVAQRQEQTSLAIHRLSTAMAKADELGTHHLAAQVRLWLAPLLPRREAQTCLAEARAIAEAGGRRLLLEEVKRLESELLDF